MTYTTDNRWSPGASGATVPDTAPAAYSARWIDMGDDALADVLPDRQGFAYNDTDARDRLIAFLVRDDHRIRTPNGIIDRDVTYVVEGLPDGWTMYQRRAGGYIYVDAWLEPDAIFGDPDTAWNHLGY